MIVATCLRCCAASRYFCICIYTSFYDSILHYSIIHFTFSTIIYIIYLLYMHKRYELRHVRRARCSISICL